MFPSDPDVCYVQQGWRTRHFGSLGNQAFQNFEKMPYKWWKGSRKCLILRDYLWLEKRAEKWAQIKFTRDCVNVDIGEERVVRLELTGKLLCPRLIGPCISLEKAGHGLIIGRYTRSATYARFLCAKWTFLIRRRHEIPPPNSP